MYMYMYMSFTYRLFRSIRFCSVRKEELNGVQTADSHLAGNHQRRHALLYRVFIIKHEI